MKTFLFVFFFLPHHLGFFPLFFIFCPPHFACLLVSFVAIHLFSPFFPICAHFLFFILSSLSHFLKILLWLLTPFCFVFLFLLFSPYVFSLLFLFPPPNFPSFFFLPFLFSFCLVLPIFSPCPYFFFLIFLFSTFRFFPLPLFLLSFHALPSHAFMGD